MRLIVKGYDAEDRLVFEDMKKVYKSIEPSLDHYLSQARAQFENVKHFHFDLWTDQLISEESTRPPRKPSSLLTNGT